MKRVFRTILLSKFLLLAGLSSAFAVETVSDSSKLSLVAESRFSFLWTPITDASLSVPTFAEPPESILDPDYEKRLKIDYLVPLTKARMVQLAEKSLDKVALSERQAHAGDIAAFYTYLDDVEAGDSYALHWRPAKGLTLTKNEELVATVSSAGAAQLILSIWLGENAISRSQRNRMIRAWREAVPVSPSLTALTEE